MDTFLIVNYECLLEDTTILIVLRLVYNVVSMDVKYVMVMVVYVTYIVYLHGAIAKPLQVYSGHQHNIIT